MTEPLLFVCIREPQSTAELAPTRFVTIPSPTGPAFMAFASQELAAAVAVLYGVADNVHLIPETQLSPELVGALTEHRVVVLATGDDYNGATSNDSNFPWLDRVILYDFQAALARPQAP